jgi:hypothetical protein
VFPEESLRTDAEQIIERLRTVESMRQSSIKNQTLQIEEDLEMIERIVRRVELANDDGLYNSATGVLLTSAVPGSVPVETVRGPRAASMVELIQQFADISSHIERLASKAITVQVDFPTDDFPRETAERLEIIARCDRYTHAISVKDHMLWSALQDKEKVEEQLSDERRLSHEYAQEIANWAEVAQDLSQQVVQMKQEKEKMDKECAKDSRTRVAREESADALVQSDRAHQASSKYSSLSVHLCRYLRDLLSLLVWLVSCCDRVCAVGACYAARAGVDFSGMVACW